MFPIAISRVRRTLSRALPLLFVAIAISGLHARAADQIVYPSGGYFDASFSGYFAAIVLPHNNALASTTINISPVFGLAPNAPNPNRDSDGAGSTVLETIGFSVSKDVTFDGLPALKFIAPPDLGSAPISVRIYDGATKQRIAIVAGFPYANAAFLSNYGTPFEAKAGRIYYAEYIKGGSNALSTGFSKSPTTIRLPKVDGIRAFVDLPPVDAEPAAVANLIASSNPPSQLPELRGAGIGRVDYYASIVVTGQLSASGSVVVRLVLPPGAGEPKRYALAAYDSDFRLQGWSTGFRPASISGRSLEFQFHLPAYLGWRQYGVALYREDAASADAASKKEGAGTNHASAAAVTVLGDSLSLLTILPPSPIGCVPGWGPLPQCQYINDPQSNWPGVLAQITGDRVANLAILGTTTTVDGRTGPSMLTVMVPQIPRNAAAVVCQCGVNDVSFSGGSLATVSRAAQLTDAILARAPHARIIYIGIRCFTGCSHAGVEAWNTEFRRLAALHGGAFVGLEDLAPDGASASFPDGSHPSPAVAAQIAGRVAAVLRGWNLPNL